MRRHAALYLPRKDGTRLADHCEAVAEATGDWPEEFPLPEIPFPALDVWDWYWELRAAAPSGINGADPLSHTEIAAWATLTGIPLTPPQTRLLRLMDAEFIAKARESSKQTAASSRTPPVPSKTP